MEVVARRQDNTGCGREKRDEQEQEREVSGLGELRREPPPPKATSTSPMTNETQLTAKYDPINWMTALGSERRCDFQGPSAFVKSIPCLTLPILSEAVLRGGSLDRPIGSRPRPAVSIGLRADGSLAERSRRADSPSY